MASYNFNYSFNISGNCNAIIEEMTGNIDGFRNRVEETQGVFAKFGGELIKFNQLSQWVSNLSSTLKETLAPGAALNTKLAELQAIAGPTAEELALVEKYARSTAKEFGVSAAGAVESYKLLLSQLSPELTKNGEALNRSLTKTWQEYLPISLLLLNSQRFLRLEPFFLLNSSPNTLVIYTP